MACKQLPVCAFLPPAPTALAVPLFEEEEETGLVLSVLQTVTRPNSYNSYYYYYYNYCYCCYYYYYYYSYYYYCYSYYYYYCYYYYYYY